MKDIVYLRGEEGKNMQLAYDLLTQAGYAVETIYVFPMLQPEMRTRPVSMKKFRGLKEIKDFIQNESET